MTNTATFNTENTSRGETQTSDTLRLREGEDPWAPQVEIETKEYRAMDLLLIYYDL